MGGFAVPGKAGGKWLLVLVAANALLFSQGAFGHWWEHSSGDCHYHIHESTIEVYKGTSYPNTKQSALDDWTSNTDINFVNRAGHDDTVNLSVLAGDYGDTGWWGLASLEDTDLDWDHCGAWPNSAKVAHGHSRWNYFYGGTVGTAATSDARGIWCQEIGHVIGLDHSDTGDCMGKTYFNDINITSGHNWIDINSDY